MVSAALAVSVCVDNIFTSASPETITFPMSREYNMKLMILLCCCSHAYQISLNFMRDLGSSLLGNLTVCLYVKL